MFENLKDYLTGKGNEEESKTSARYAAIFTIDAADEQQANAIIERVEEGFRDIPSVTDIYTDLSGKNPRGGFSLTVHLTFTGPISEKQMRKAEEVPDELYNDVIASGSSSVQFKDVYVER